MRTRRAILVVLLDVVIGTALLSQTTPAESFEAVAIKPFNMEKVKVGFQTSGARLEAGAVTLKDIIGEAYGVADQWISGSSNWMESERYNIQATAGRPATRSEFRAMLQNMLADRFHLTVHHEPRQMKAYALVVDKGGLKLTPKTEPFQLAPAISGQVQIEVGDTIRDLVRELNLRRAQRLIGGPVVDRTGLNGEYHIALTYESQPLPGGSGVRIDIDYFSALKRELGLRLDPIQESFDQIVVVSATKPTPD